MCQCDLITNPFSFKMGISTGTPTAVTTTDVTSYVGSGKNSETYWVSGRNIFPVTKFKSIQACKLDYFRSASIITKNCKKGLPDEKNISLENSKSKITLTSWIYCIWSYMEDNGMDTVFCVYNPDLKSEVYLLDDWGAAKYGKFSKQVQTLTNKEVGGGTGKCLPV